MEFPESRCVVLVPAIAAKVIGAGALLNRFVGRASEGLKRNLSCGGAALALGDIFAVLLEVNTAAVSCRDAWEI